MFKTIVMLALLSPPSDWPNGVPWIEGAKEYGKNVSSQRIVILNGADNNTWHQTHIDDVFANAPTVVNPNREFPWQNPGGLDSDNFKNKTYLYTPPGTQIQLETRYVAIEKAERPLPRYFWWHPDGTVFIDQLFNENNECFEVRMRKKISGNWHNFRYMPTASEYVTQDYIANVYNPLILNRHGIFRSNYRIRVVHNLRGVDFERVSLHTTYTDRGNLVPRNYFGPGLHCNDCHMHSGSAVYGIGVRGGGDGDFSFNPYQR